MPVSKETKDDLGRFHAKVTSEHLYFATIEFQIPPSSKHYAILFADGYVPWGSTIFVGPNYQSTFRKMT